jgi:hypothetical protein
MTSSLQRRPRTGAFARFLGRSSRLVPAAISAGLLGGCVVDRLGAPTPASAPAAPGVVAQSASPVPMGGRWQLASPGAGQCAMTLGGQAGASEGTIAPEGGCPGDFFTSRKWTFEGGALVIRDHNGQPLGQLKHAAGRFDGRSVAGAEISLAR